MKEKPILFNAEMVRAILEGRKTQTRRVVKPQPIINDNGSYNWDFKYKGFRGSCGTHIERFPSTATQYCPYGEIGSRLWVRETCKIWGEENTDHIIKYKADEQTTPFDDLLPDKWKPSIFMPRWASRIQLEITNIRVEKLNGISEEDAKAEGVSQAGVETGSLDVNGNAIEIGSYAASFCELWQSINGKDQHKSWDANPWVWVVEFERENDEQA